MNETSITVLVDVLTDIKVEVAVISLALQQNDVPRQTINDLRSEVDETAIRDEVREKLLPALFSE